MQKLDYKIIEPKETANACIIWLHGLGASADDFVPLVPQLQLPLGAEIRFIFPQAPVQPVTLNGGYEMPSWYDIYGLDRDSKQDEPGIRNSEQMLMGLINEQIDLGVPSERIVLAGFSQGGAVVLHTALRFAQKLGGVMVLSSYLPIADFLAEEKNPANSQLPIFIAHGEKDTVVPLLSAELTLQYLQAENYEVDMHLYPMGHEVCLAEISDISQWLQTSLG
jgi:phospholipase/carboxylesterase